MLLDCTFHNSEREVLLDLVQIHRNDYNRFDYFCKIMQNKCPTIVNALGKYISTGFRRRQAASVLDPPP